MFTTQVEPRAAGDWFHWPMIARGFAHHIIFISFADQSAHKDSPSYCKISFDYYLLFLGMGCWTWLFCFLSLLSIKSLTLKLLNLLLLFSFSNSKHTSMASLAILSNFFEEQTNTVAGCISVGNAVLVWRQSHEKGGYTSQKSTLGTRIPPATQAIPFGIVAYTFCRQPFSK